MNKEQEKDYLRLKSQENFNHILNAAAAGAALFASFGYTIDLIMAVLFAILGYILIYKKSI